MGNDTTSEYVQCPVCHAPDVRRSWPNGWRDTLMARMGKVPLRCRRCTHRFYRRLRANERLGRPDVSNERDAVL